jgi:hypothetical protein
MKCDRCGYSDNGTGDWAHACGPVSIQRAPVANTRIQELAEQAEIKFEAHLQHLGIDTAVITPADLEKFAEAIIRECCIALNPMLRDMISRGQGVDMIKLHFGMNPKEITTRMLDTAIDQMEKQLAEKKHDS